MATSGQLVQYVGAGVNCTLINYYRRCGCELYNNSQTLFWRCLWDLELGPKALIQYPECSEGTTSD